MSERPQLPTGLDPVPPGLDKLFSAILVIAATVMVWLLLRGTRAFGDVARFDIRFKQRLWRIVLASLLMGVVLWALWILMGPLFGIAGVRWIALLVLIVLGSLSYFGIGQLIGAFRLSELRGSLRR